MPRLQPILLALGLMAASASSQEPAESFWPRWRGPLDTGAAPAADPPVEWSESKNVRWKVPIPGRGHSTPVVWGDRIFLTTSVAEGPAARPRRHDAPGAHDNVARVRRQKSIVLAIDRRDGGIVWQRCVHEGLPHEGGHVTGSFASASPVTDGRVLIASFGSRGVYGLGLDGRPRWSVDLGDMQTKHAHGEGSSPALFGDTAIVNWDHEGQSFVVALDVKTGKQRWRVARPEVSSWSTPLVVVHGGKPQVVVSGSKHLRSYDLESGRVLWECGGLAHNVVASPVAGDGMVFAASSYEKQAMLAIRLDGAKGDLSRSENLAWVRRRRTPYVPSPLLYEGTLYLLHHYQGRLSRVVAKTGEEPTAPLRLRPIGNVYASPVAAAGRVYVTDRHGTTLVLEHGKEESPRRLAVNRLDDRFSASAALAGKELYLRGERFLYCLAADG